MKSVRLANDFTQSRTILSRKKSPLKSSQSSRTKALSFLYLGSTYSLNKLTFPLTPDSSWFFCKLMTQVRQFPRPNRGSFGKAVPTTVAPMEEPAANPDSIL